MENGKNMRLRALCEGGIMVALAIGLSYFKFKIWANGGSVDLVMIPLLIYAVRWGTPWGLGAGLVFGTLKFILAGGYAWGWTSIFLDYSIAYALVGLAGIFKHQKMGMVPGAIVGGCARFVAHFISGVTIYAITAPTELFNTTFTNPWLYSLAYNASFMVPNIIIAVVVGLIIPSTALRKYIMGEDLK